VRFSAVKGLFSDRAHWEVARSIPRSVEYCKKDGDYVEIGSRSVAPGKRSDLQDFKRAVQGGLLHLNDVREEYSDVYAKYPRFCLEYLHQKAPKRELPNHPQKAWQRLLEERLNAPPNDREILFVVDEKGGQGKSYFSADFRRRNEETTFLSLPGKKADMVYALSTCGFTPGIILVDAPRSKQGDFIQYDFLEELKNGAIFNTKYESRLIEMAVPHVCVFMNEQPDMTKLSADRYSIITL